MHIVVSYPVWNDMLEIQMQAKDHGIIRAAKFDTYCHNDKKINIRIVTNVKGSIHIMLYNKMCGRYSQTDLYSQNDLIGLLQAISDHEYCCC